MPRTPIQAVAFLLGFATALFLAPLTVQLARADTDGPFAELEALLLEQVNAVRVRHHLIPLQRTAELDAIARSHSNDMVRRNYFSHQSPEGANPLQRLTEAGLSDFTLVAENLGKTGRGEPNREIVESWLASPDHRRNLLTPPFNRTGIGIARAVDGSLVYTQVYLTVPR